MQTDVWLHGLCFGFALQSYSMRNSILCVLGEMVIRVLSRDNLEDKEKNTRDQFLDKLGVKCSCELHP